MSVSTLLSSILLSDTIFDGTVGELVECFSVALCRKVNLIPAWNKCLSDPQVVPSLVVVGQIASVGKQLKKIALTN